MNPASRIQLDSVPASHLARALSSAQILVGVERTALAQLARSIQPMTVEEAGILRGLLRAGLVDLAPDGDFRLTLQGELVLAVLARWPGGGAPLS